MAAGNWKDMLVAAQRGDLALVEYYIKEGVNPNYQHPELLTTPLIESIEFNHLDIAAFLLENGADPLLKAGFSADTALSIAKKKRKRAAIKLLKSYRKGR